MWILIDNYDSFTHILHHYLLQLNTDVRVLRNDAVSLEEVITLAPERIIISPGPQTPLEAGITSDIITYFVSKIPILGICLGHQALGMYFGARLNKALQPVHGNTASIFHNQDELFKDIPQSFLAMRYHSLIIDNYSNTDIVPLAFTDEHELMAFKHKIYPATGIQFHPESILTEFGLQLLQNWHRQYQ
jgi:anthranilate synthase/aminodeoxychorismate synthase-like glutamine amidotransferase